MQVLQTPAFDTQDSSEPHGNQDASLRKVESRGSREMRSLAFSLCAAAKTRYPLALAFNHLS